MKKRKIKKNKEKGITLVALVITIIILIILATVTINFAFGDNGLIRQAELARDLTANSTKYEEESTANLVVYMNEVMGGDSGISDGIPEIPMSEAKGQEEGFSEKTIVVDNQNNKITVPEGFKIADDSGDTVQQGIVIEDVSASTDTAVQGSQYVWIPVGSFTNDAGETKEVILGRYTFSTSSPGTPTLVQAAFNEPETENGGDGIPDNIPDYTDQSDSVVISSYYKELVDYREGIASSGTDGENATAKDLAGFLNSAKNNGGYYIGRYEASFASGSSVADYKAASKVSNGYSEESMSYSAGTLWNYITELDASKVAINTYAGSNSVTSDLMNSYAWDTAIVYIQQAGNTNYANQTRAHTSLSNTGNLAEGVKDEVCKINDMASNVRERTTEYSSNTNSSFANPCVSRGGIYNGSNIYTAYRVNGKSTLALSYIGFRLSLYL